MTTRDALVGAWSLESYVSTDLHGGDPRHPLGEDARGLIIYTGDGWMSALLAAGGRQPYADGSVHGGSVAERADAAAGTVAYSGSYRVEGDVVIHAPAVSLLPNWEGGEVARRFRYERNLLHLDLLSPLPSTFGPRLGTLIWRRCVQLPR